MLVVLGIGCLSVIPANAAKALSGSEFQAGRIADDAIFFNGNGMDANQVQAFLNSKVPNCDTNGSQPYAGTTAGAYGASKGYPPPYTCMKDYRQDTHAIAGDGLCNGFSGGHKSAAQIIYEVGMSCGINQKVILITLQKEQSLVTDDWPWSKQYNAATGYACPDTAACDPNFAGFFKQVYFGARQFKRYAQDGHIFTSYRPFVTSYIQYNPNANCGGTNVYVQNQATSGLYIYTPYQPNAAALANLYGTGDGCSAYGNRNFWRLFNDWFGNPVATTLLQMGSGSTVYLVHEGRKYAVPSGNVLDAYGLASTPVTPVSDIYLGSLQNGGLLTNALRIEGDGTVYMADNGRRYGIPSGSACVHWAIDCVNNVAVLTPQLAAILAPAGTLQPLMNHQGTVYLLNNGKKEPFLSPQALFDKGYGWGSVSAVGTQLNASQQMGRSYSQNSSLVKFAASPAIYYYLNNNYYAIPSFTSFRSWFTANDKVFGDNISAYNSTPPTVVSSIPPPLISYGGKKYLVDQYRKFDLTSVSTSWPMPTDATNFTALVDRIPVVPVTSASTWQLPSGAIFKVENGKVNYFYSISEFLLSGSLAQNVFGVSGDSISGIGIGPGVLNPGASIKFSTNPAIYVVGSNNIAYSLGNMSDFSTFRLSMNRVYGVDTQAFTYYTQTIKELPYLASDAVSNKYIITLDGTKISATPGVNALWGINPTSYQTFDTTLLNNIPLSSVTASFAYHKGTIYYGKDGQKHPIGDFSTYRNLGGNANNTFGASDSFISNSPTGSSY